MPSESAGFTIGCATFSWKVWSRPAFTGWLQTRCVPLLLVYSFRCSPSTLDVCTDVRGGCISVDTCFSEKVRLYSILMEDVHELKEFVVKHCRVVCFSRGGQYFAFAHNAQVGSRPLTGAQLLKRACSSRLHSCSTGFLPDAARHGRRLLFLYNLSNTP